MASAFQLAPLARLATPLILAGTATSIGYYLFNRDHTIKTTMFNGWAAHLKNVSALAVQTKVWLGPFGVGKESVTTHLLMSEEESEEFLRGGERTTSVDRPGNPIYRWDTNVLPSNHVCEDRHAIDLISVAGQHQLTRRDEGQSFWQKWFGIRTSVLPFSIGDGETIRAQMGDGSKDLVMFSVFDGHAGWSVSQLLNRILHPCLAYAIASNGDCRTTSVMQTIVDAFLAVDKDIINVQLDLAKSTAGPTQSILPVDHPAGLALAEIGTVGSCALSAIIDVTIDKLYVANLGDSRAVAGWWDPVKQLWRCDILSEDLMGDNPRESARIISEHPDNEADTAMFDRGYGNRIRGMGQPTRSFGDSHDKLTEAECDLVRDVLQNRKQEGLTPSLTPPYLTAEPEVVCRELHPASGEDLKFLIMATDGLWDRMSSEEATLLISAHVAHPHHPDVSKTTLPSLFPQAPPTADHPWPVQPLPGSTPEQQKEYVFKSTSAENRGSWAFEDTNAATHLIRNSLGGNDRDLRTKILSCKGDHSRQMRDDITATVVYFGEPTKEAKDAS